MPLQKVRLIPGVNKTVTPSLNSAGVSDANLVRWRAGLPEKMRGWTRQVLSGAALLGVPRSIMPFFELAGDMLAGIGTHLGLYVVRGSSCYDITPLDRTLTVAIGGIVTVSGSATVTATTSAANNLAVGDRVTFDTIVNQTRTPSGITVGGIAMTGDVLVSAIVSSAAFRFVASGPATSSAASTVAATLQCYLPSGQRDETLGLGWGAGPWGSGPWGGPATEAANRLPARIWSLDAWGEWLLGVPTRSRLFVFRPNATTGAIDTRAVEVVNSGTPAAGPPLQIMGMMVGMPERHVVLFGCSDLNSTNSYDPMLIRWSDVETLDTYQALATNAAGSFRLQGGAHIVGWLGSTQQIIVWTDTTAWTMRFVGLPFVYSFQRMEGTAGLVAQMARGELDGAVYWWGMAGFWVYRGGAPQQLQCSLQDEIFGVPGENDSGYEIGQASKIICATNALYGEIMWFYPSSGSTEINRYVCYSAWEKCWYGGALSRTAWSDRGVGPHPLGLDPNGRLYYHEVGTSADGEPMGDYLQTGFWDLSDGEDIMLVASLVPDFQHFSGPISVEVQMREWPNAPARTKGPYTITSETKQIPVRARGRQIALRFVGGDASSMWRFGAVRANVQPDGTRG
jgi:hypothetical protein